MENTFFHPRTTPRTHRPQPPPIDAIFKHIFEQVHGVRGKGKGVCGTSWELSKTIIVDDVDEFPGHIACSSLSKSEIVLPLIKDGAIVAILDLDSDKIADFNAVDQKYLSNLCEWLVTVI